MSLPPPTKDEIISIVGKGIERRQPPDEPFVLASGAKSWEYADVKYPLSPGRSLLRLGSYAVTRLQQEGIDFSVVGGLTMGATPLTMAISLSHGGLSHFEVCKEPETRYSLVNPLSILGARLTPGDRVLITEDTTSTGASAEQAIDTIERICAEQQINDVEVVGVCTVLDRGREASQRFTSRGLAFVALTTYKDLGLEPLN